MARKVPHVIVERCVRCDRAVAKDGCKGVLVLAVAQKDTRLLVTEVAGCDWSGSQFDMRLVCACGTRARHVDSVSALQSVFPSAGPTA